MTSTATAKSSLKDTLSNVSDMFVISHGPDEEWFNTEEEAVDAAFDWSIDEGGATITVSRLVQGRVMPHMEVFA